MRKRIDWLLPALSSVNRTMGELFLARVAQAQIRSAAAEGADMTGLHVASILQSSDLLGPAQTGLLLGAGLGAAGGVAAAKSLGSSAAPAFVVIALAGLGAILGTWSSSMIGSFTPSRRLRRFDTFGGPKN